MLHLAEEHAGLKAPHQRGTERHLQLKEFQTPDPRKR